MLQLLLTLICLLVPAVARGAVLDLRETVDVPKKALEIAWEYSDLPIIPGRLKISELSKRPQDFWLDQADLPQRASYRITILRKADQASLLLVFKDWPAFRAIVNGQTLLEKGKLYNGFGDIENKRGDVSLLLPQAEAIEVLLELGASLPRWNHAPKLIYIGTEADLRKQELRNSIILAILLGGLFIIGLYHISLFVLTPARSVTLILGAFCMVNCLRCSISGNVDILYNFFPDFPFGLSYKLSYIGYYLSPALFIEFLKFSFPGTLSHRTLRYLWLITVTFIVMTVITPLAVYGRWNSAFHGVTLISIVIATICIKRAIKNRTKGAWLQLVSFLLVSMATINDVMYAEGLPNIGLTIPFAVFIFILLQSMILSSQFSQAFAELAHTYKEFTKIVYLHTVKQIASGLEIEKTMRVGTADAVVLAFDIVGSSRLKHPGLSDAIERMMGRCYEAMSEGYDAVNMHSRAYRVKEMGDGLLCSVGFPFPTGARNCNSSVAVALAVDFMRIFKEEFEKLNLEIDAFCGIGIAKGQVEGFFPRFGVKQYDLRGKTIVLATRYESMRNAVFNRAGWKGSVIFLQDDVYQELAVGEQALYTEWDATADGQRIRDDGQAKKAWFRFVPHAVCRDKRAIDCLVAREDDGERALKASA